MRLGYTLQQPQQEVVKPLALAVFVDHQPLHLRNLGARRRFRPYNALDHDVAVSA
jgi:hypothetical protein